jgi:site-specific recombinase XerD
MEMYLKDRDIADSTLRAHRRRITRLVEWCDAEAIDNINDLTGRQIHRFKIEAFESKDNGGNYSKETIRSVMDTMRVFIRWCESIDAVPQGTSEKVQSPSPENTRDEALERNQAASILKYLHQYEYASHRHSLVDLFWHTGIRLGGAHGLDLETVHLDENYIELHHRPEEETPLKNGESGERLVNISTTSARVLPDYIDHNRHDVEDDYGRRPLFTSKQGRRAKSNLREIIYGVTRPCVYTNRCPHDRNIEDCDAAGGVQDASKCPSSLYPHAFRRGSITHHLREDTPKRLVSDRMDVNMETLDKHYDTRSDMERMEQRWDYLPFESDE